MSCTTILVGKKASWNGSTMIARNDDSASGHYMPKKFVVVHPEQQPRTYKSVISHVEIELPDNPMRYTAMPNAVEGKGTWAAAGANSAGVAMTATETITSNERVLGADPLVEYEKKDGVEKAGGIGEEDIVVLVLPYIHSAREGVERLGTLLEKYGTYESNGIAFADEEEIWWFECVGGHHYLAVRVPDDAYVVIDVVVIIAQHLAPHRGAVRLVQCVEETIFRWNQATVGDIQHHVDVRRIYHFP